MNDGSIVQMLVSGRNDLMWFESNVNKLISKYNNQFIAFRNKEVIDSDSKLDNLLYKLKKKNIDTSDVFIKFVSKIKTIL